MRIENTTNAVRESANEGYKSADFIKGSGGLASPNLNRTVVNNLARCMSSSSNPQAGIMLAITHPEATAARFLPTFQLAM